MFSPLGVKVKNEGVSRTGGPSVVEAGNDSRIASFHDSSRPSQQLRIMVSPGC